MPVCCFALSLLLSVAVLAYSVCLCVCVCVCKESILEFAKQEMGKRERERESMWVGYLCVVFF